MLQPQTASWQQQKSKATTVALNILARLANQGIAKPSTLPKLVPSV